MSFKHLTELSIIPTKNIVKQRLHGDLEVSSFAEILGRIGPNSRGDPIRKDDSINKADKGIQVFILIQIFNQYVVPPRHRQLAPSAFVRVSPRCLGAMIFTERQPERYEVSKDTAFAIMNHFYSQGGNFIDTANAYQFGQSEEWVGERMAARKNRDEIVLATNSSPATWELIRTRFNASEVKKVYGVLREDFRRPKDSKREGNIILSRNLIPLSEYDKNVSWELEKLTSKKGVLLLYVALAYVMHKTPYIFLMVGGRTVDPIAGSIDALSVSLSKEETDEIETSYEFDLGFPHVFISGTLFINEAPRGGYRPDDVFLTKPLGSFDWSNLRSRSRLRKRSNKGPLERARKVEQKLFPSSHQSVTGKRVLG
ncbi:uncharacterized protein Z519_05835 [Cladophialophora bantiana CBS 173.52]|uniref:NADP-dependent oxidoreductase domain-containing protein n=1 Tax=Cladophialophora bantiana (strain ATCC 10958 / CBS 173.52 / CDC B-1940 / NIH 8579) TaxID=1442370 RepID=A0A0D2HQV2_CLAB1|nr:uncharacterized protein Z519_05835 [Cladophialophora bantiana CBS 173.52]KIW93230.1 hypothetical protein Z519_05835 [Cladophialophora bantiana CBS 173.52]